MINSELADTRMLHQNINCSTTVRAFTGFNLPYLIVFMHISVWYRNISKKKVIQKFFKIGITLMVAISTYLIIFQNYVRSTYFLFSNEVPSTYLLLPNVVPTIYMILIHWSSLHLFSLHTCFSGLKWTTTYFLATVAVFAITIE